MKIIDHLQNKMLINYDSNFLRKFSNTVTDIGARADVISNGAGMKYPLYQAEPKQIKNIFKISRKNKFMKL